MNRSFLAALAILVALAPVSLAQAQTHPHAGMSMQDHAAMPAAPSANGVSTTPADNAMLSAAPTEFSVTFPHAMTLTSLKLTGPAGQATDVAVTADASPGTTVHAPLPALAPGSYSAAWAATGADGHQMNGVVRFMVH
ncbi:MAG: copper resistance protein CopC [Alphaproteobacteria bacterium]|nr:copper resistance protein CopC [Alphaproteobacteria bacterium]MBU2398778.1 copper resistance protein CopC [Alphaproteobacteria bacterium]